MPNHSFFDDWALSLLDGMCERGVMLDATSFSGVELGAGAATPRLVVGARRHGECGHIICYILYHWMSDGLMPAK